MRRTSSTRPLPRLRPLSKRRALPAVPVALGYLREADTADVELDGSRPIVSGWIFMPR